MGRLSRRHLLAVLAGATSIAGCGGATDDPSATESTATESKTSPVDPSTTTATSVTTSTTTKSQTTKNTSTSSPTEAPDIPALPTEPSPPQTMDDVRTSLDHALDIADARIEAGPFEPTWDSLAGFQVPKWFRDRKFGIYFHWGLYSVPAYETEWYPKWMYEPDRHGWGSDIYDIHVRYFGEPDEFPYQDFAPYFHAQEFDAAEWARVFDQAGAGFAGPVVEHHDGWSNWQSIMNPYNADNQGPQRDLVGELAAAIRGRGMKFVTTFHHGRAARGDRVNAGDDSDGYYNGAYEHFPSVTRGFPNKIMYRNVNDRTRWDLWFGKLVEVLERYEPDLVWHDSIHVPPEETKLRYLAYNFNRALAQDRDIAVTYKEVEFTESLRESVAIRDYENDQADDLRDRPWLTDTSIANGSWAFSYDLDWRSVRELIHELITIVSKNGQLLLNVQPRSDGQLPRAVVDRLQGMGAWLTVHGEAIYETRPWRTWRDGDSIRYTRSKDGSTLYGLYLDWPGEGPLRFPSISATNSDAASAELVGYGPVEIGVDRGAVTVTIPELERSQRPSEIAVAVRFENLIN